MDNSLAFTVAMDHTNFLKDSDENTYILPDYVKTSRTKLESYFRVLRKQINVNAENRDVVILTDILTPYSHCIPIEAKWWYRFLSRLATSNSNIRLVRDRGTAVAFCSSCNSKVSIHYTKHDKWVCPYCSVSHDATENTLKNMQRDHEFFVESETFRKSREPIQRDQTSTSALKYLFSKIVSSTYPRTPEYDITTDSDSHRYLKAMNKTCLYVRSLMIDEITETKSLDGSLLDYRAWVDKWNDRHGSLSQTRKINGGVLAYLSVSDTIISICEMINVSRNIPQKTDPLWIVYWRNIIVDRQRNRVTLPRFRGRYLQLPKHAVIPMEKCYTEIMMTSDGNFKLRFVLGGNHILKVETISGKHHRGRNRRNTREPRLEFTKD